MRTRKCPRFLLRKTSLVICFDYRPNPQPPTIGLQFLEPDAPKIHGIVPRSITEPLPVQAGIAFDCPQSDSSVALRDCVRRHCCRSALSTEFAVRLCSGSIVMLMCGNAGRHVARFVSCFIPSVFNCTCIQYMRRPFRATTQHIVPFIVIDTPGACALQPPAAHQQSRRSLQLAKSRA